MIEKVSIEMQGIRAEILMVQKERIIFNIFNKI